MRTGEPGTDSSASGDTRSHRMRINIAISTLASIVAELPSTEEWTLTESMAGSILSCMETLAPEYNQDDLFDTLLAYLVGKGQNAFLAGDRIRRFRLWMIQHGSYQHRRHAGHIPSEALLALAICYAQVYGYESSKASGDHVLQKATCVSQLCQVTQIPTVAHHDVRSMGFSICRCHILKEGPIQIFWSKNARHRRPWVHTWMQTHMPCLNFDQVVEHVGAVSPSSRAQVKLTQVTHAKAARQGRVFATYGPLTQDSFLMSLSDHVETWCTDWFSQIPSALVHAPSTDKLKLGYCLALGASINMPANTIRTWRIADSMNVIY